MNQNWWPNYTVNSKEDFTCDFVHVSKVISSVKLLSLVIVKPLLSFNIL